MSVLAEEQAVINSIDNAFFVGDPRGSYDDYLRVTYPDLFAPVDKALGPDTSGRNYFGSWPQPWPKPSKAFEGTFDWHHLIEPAGTLDQVEVFEPAQPDVSQPDVSHEISNKGWLTRAKNALKSTTLGRITKKAGEWLSGNRTAAIAYCVGAAATVSAGISVIKGVADLHTFDTLSSAAYTFLELDNPPQQHAQTRANYHFAEAGSASLLSASAIGIGVVLSHFKAYDRKREELPEHIARVQPYATPRPHGYLISMPEQAALIRAARISAAAWRANAQAGFCAKINHDEWPLPKNTTTSPARSCPDVNDPTLSDASKAMLQKFELTLSGLAAHLRLKSAT